MPWNKRTVVLALFVVVALVAAACGGDSEGETSVTTSAVTEPAETSPAETSTDPDDTIVIAEFSAGLAVSFPASISVGIHAAAAELGFEVVTFDSEFDVATEARNVDEMLTQEIDIVIFQATDGAAAAEAVQKIVDAGIPVVAVHTQVGADRDFEDVFPALAAFVTQSEYQAGQTAGHLALEALPGGGTVAIIEGSGCCYEAVADRTNGFKDIVEGEGFTIVATEPGAWIADPAQAACAGILESQPDVDLFYTHSDDMAAGCAVAVTAAGSDAIVIGVGGSVLGIDSINEGTVYGTVCYKPYSMGELAVSVAAEVLAGTEEPGPSLIMYDTPAISAANVDECAPQW